MDEPLVYIIILNYKSFPDTRECLLSIKKIKYSNYKVVIVDNNSMDGSEQKIKEKFPEYFFIQTGKNDGYAAGNNIGIKFALQQSADYICVLNNDTLVRPDFMNILIAYMQQNKDIGITGPEICEYKNNDLIQSTGGKINLYTGISKCINFHKSSGEIKNETINCDFIVGACILARSEVFKKIGLLPEFYFLYYEETDWCMKAKKHGYGLICVPSAKIIHKGSASVSKLSDNGLYYIARNRVVFEKRNATFLQRVIFYMSIFMRSVYYILARKNKIILKAYIDGLNFRWS